MILRPSLDIESPRAESNANEFIILYINDIMTDNYISH